MVDGHDHALFAVERGAQGVEADHFDTGLHDILGQAGEPRHAEEVGTEGVKVLPHEAPDFAIVEPVAEGNRQIAVRQPPVTGQHGPSGPPEPAAEAEDERQGKPPQHGQQGERQQINRVIHE